MGDLAESLWARDFTGASARKRIHRTGAERNVRLFKGVLPVGLDIFRLRYEKFK
jgi:hypothetical protein